MATATLKSTTSEKLQRVFELDVGQVPAPFLGESDSLPAGVAKQFSPKRYVPVSESDRRPRERLVKDILPVGKWKVGRDPKTKDILLWDVEPQTLDLINVCYRRLEQNGGRACLCWGHGPEIEPGKPFRAGTDPKSLIAPIDELVLANDVLWASWYVTPEEHKDLKNPSLQVSVRALENYIDGAGNYYELALVHVAVVDHAAVMGQGPFIDLSNKVAEVPDSASLEGTVMDLAGTADGVKKAWETRKHGAVGSSKTANAAGALARKMSDPLLPANSGIKGRGDVWRESQNAEMKSRGAHRFAKNGAHDTAANLHLLAVKHHLRASNKSHSEKLKTLHVEAAKSNLAAANANRQAAKVQPKDLANQAPPDAGSRLLTLSDTGATQMADETTTTETSGGGDNQVIDKLRKLLAMYDVALPDDITMEDLPLAIDVLLANAEGPEEPDEGAGNEGVTEDSAAVPDDGAAPYALSGSAIPTLSSGATTAKGKKKHIKMVTQPSADMQALVGVVNTMSTQLKELSNTVDSFVSDRARIAKSTYENKVVQLIADGGMNAKFKDHYLKLGATNGYNLSVLVGFEGSKPLDVGGSVSKPHATGKAPEVTTGRTGISEEQHKEAVAALAPRR